MPLNARQMVEALYRHLRKEQRSIPYTGSLENPLPDALLALNGAVQQMAATAPLFAARAQRAALFRAPQELALSSVTQYSATATCAAIQDYMLGCSLTIPGDTRANRIISRSGTTITLQFPFLGATPGAAVQGALSYDSAPLAADVIAVLGPVRLGNGDELKAAGGRDGLESSASSGDYGRITRRQGGNGTAYFVESAFVAAATQPQLRLMIQPAPSAAMTVEYQARVRPQEITSAWVHGSAPGYADPNTPIPVPASFVESVFLPLAVARFYSTPVMRDVPKPTFVDEAAAAALAILENLRPQGNRPAYLAPCF